MRETAIEHIRALFRAHDDLAGHLSAAALTKKLPVPSNTVGEQFWCIVGARESYTSALEHDGWAGFACSLAPKDVSNPQKIAAALRDSAARFEGVVSSLEWTATRDGLLLDLLEHETQHQGQLIRYVYGLGESFPESWVTRWNLSNK